MGDNVVLTKRQATGEILKLGIPAITEQILFTAVTIVSTAIVSHLGRHELLAATWNGTLFNFFMSIFIGLALGTTVVISRNQGAGKLHSVPLIMNVSLIMAMGAGLVMVGVFYFTIRNFYAFFYSGSESLTIEYATTYGRIMLYGLPLGAGQAVLIGSIRGVGNNRMPLFLNSIINVANAVLSYMMVNGILFPRMGLNGAAWGLNAARLIGFLISVIYVFFINRELRPIFHTAHLWSTPVSKRIMHIGVPSAVESIITNGGFVILSMVLVVLGTVLQGGYNIASNANAIIGAPAGGLGIAMTVLISKAIGARRYDDAEMLVKQAYKISTLMVLILTVGELMFAKQIVLLYTKDPEILQAGVFSLRMFAAISIFLGTAITQAGVLKGAGAAKYVAMTMFVGLWVCRVFCAWMFTSLFGWGLVGVFIGVGMDFGSRTVLYFLKIRKGDWKYIKV